MPIAHRESHVVAAADRAPAPVTAGSIEGRFVFNLWYVAAWSGEISGKPLARRICDIPVVLFRTASGIPAAMIDRCIHRGLPLSLGRVTGEELQCGYHGMCFDTAGQCTRVPGQDRIPPRAQVQAFPVHEQDLLVWIWMGDPAKADPSKIVRYARHAESTWLWRGEHFVYKTDHLLLYDNLLDLTHVGYVHPNTIGGNENEHSNATMEVTRGEGWAKGVRWMRNSIPPAAYQALRPFAGRIDRWQVIRFDPGLVRTSMGAKDAGTAKDEEDYDDAYESQGFHGITPESRGSCHYFWSVGVPQRFAKPGMVDQKYELTRVTFEEDRAVLEAQYARRQELPAPPLVHIRSDALATAARRVWDQLLTRESDERSRQDLKQENLR